MERVHKMVGVQDRKKNGLKSKGMGTVRGCQQKFGEGFRSVQIRVIFPSGRAQKVRIQNDLRSLGILVKFRQLS